MSNTGLRNFLELSYSELEELNLRAKEQRKNRVPLDTIREERLKYLTDEKRLKAAYPIHPEVFDRLYSDWSTLVKFQRTRGVLRGLEIALDILLELQKLLPGLQGLAHDKSATAKPANPPPMRQRKSRRAVECGEFSPLSEGDLSPSKFALALAWRMSSGWRKP